MRCRSREHTAAKVLEMLRIETREAVTQCGMGAVKEFTPAFVRRM